MIPKCAKLKKVFILIFKALGIENFHYIFEREKIKETEMLDKMCEEKKKHKVELCLISSDM